MTSGTGVRQMVHSRTTIVDHGPWAKLIELCGGSESADALPDIQTQVMMDITVSHPTNPHLRAL